MDFEFSKEKSVGLLFWQSSMLWKRDINKVLVNFDITHTQYVILAVIFHLDKSGEKTTQKNISNISMIDTMTISKTVRLMQTKNLIERTEDPQDSRAKIMKITKIGMEILEKAIPAVESVDKNFFMLLNKELENFIDLMTQLKLQNVIK